MPLIRIFAAMILELSKEFTFEAAHWLPCFPEGHKCRRMHGHSFRVQVFIKGEMDPAKGYLMDYAEIKAVAKPLIEQLDHYVLNELGDKLNEPLLQNPTSENLAIWVYNQLKPRLPQLEKVKIFETCTTSCTYFGN